MKQVINNFLVMLSVVSLLLTSCKKDEEKIVASESTAPGSISASSTSLTLSKANEAGSAITFTWTNPDFGFNAALTNTLQLSKDNFTTSKEVSIDAKASSVSYNVLDFNALVLAMGLPTSTNSTIKARVKSALTTISEPAYSNEITLAVNPYPLISYVYVPGDYQGWNPGTADSLISATGNGIYEGIITFPASPGATFSFKISTAKNWTVAYGDAGAGKVSTTGGDLKVPASGKYKLTLNLNDFTFITAPYSFGVIGDATAGGWNSDTDMSYNNGTRTWTLNTALLAGALKFRLNDAWDVNYGGTNGVLASGGSDIMITAAGNYKIQMSLATNSYSITKL